MGETSEIRFAHPPAVKKKTSKMDTLLREKELLGFFLTGHPMDDYRDIIKRLSCVPLSQVETMHHDAVFRAALIVESADVRIASKSQKKFAILMVSDGMDRYELPIWPELFEEKSLLLQENQLLYAVLQLDKKEESPRLSCKWLDDLTKANEMMIEECDRAFDKAKMQAARFAKTAVEGKNKKAEKPKETKVQKSEMPLQTFSLKLDMHQVRLSHIMELKELFNEHRGATPVQIEFHSQNTTIAMLHIESRWGVSLTPQLESNIQSFLKKLK